jgi:hypothetical protein|tara:strand:- start:1424 stop:1987 length:564 start_codon:yes stop_codon:yes gene_type:complete
MKRLTLFFAFFMLPINSYPGVLTLGPGMGLERVNDTFNVDLYMIKGLYRFDNGITVGGVVQHGYIDFQQIADEKRYEAIIGYTSVLPNSKFSPYAFISKGLRSYSSSQPSVNYYTATIGSKYKITNTFYLDNSYRYRNTNDINWESNLYSLGLGRILTNNFSVQVNFGTTWGDYKSDQYSIALLHRF